MGRLMLSKNQHETAYGMGTETFGDISESLSREYEVVNTIDKKGQIQALVPKINIEEIEKTRNSLNSFVKKVSSMTQNNM